MNSVRLLLLITAAITLSAKAQPKKEAPLVPSGIEAPSASSPPSSAAPAALIIYDESSGLSQGHATQILQDADGFLWIATWNGLNRFDGYEFRRMASTAGDGCSMASDRLRDIWLSDNGDIYCLVDEGIYRFDTRKYKFSDVTDNVELRRARELSKEHQPRGAFNGKFITFTDRQGLTWELQRDHVVCRRQLRQPATLLPEEQQSQTRCLARDSKGRIWVATKEQNTMRIYDSKMHLLGYITADGRMTKNRVFWPVPIYCITQSATGTLWLGSKPGGLFRLREKATISTSSLSDLSAQTRFTVEPIAGLTCPNVYDIKEDRLGRLWIATLNGGIACVEQPEAEHPKVTNSLSLQKKSEEQRVRFIHITPDQTLIATTTNGLLVAHIEGDITKMHFRRHTKEAIRPTSLGCNATMDIATDREGRMYVSTESGGIIRLASANLMGDTLTFARCAMTGGWPTDVALSATATDSGMLIVSSNMLIDYDVKRETGCLYGTWFFNHRYRFNEVRPLLTDSGAWLLPTTQGTLHLSRSEMRVDDYVPNIVLTGITVQNGETDLAVNAIDTLELKPDKRSMTIDFAALDFVGANQIKYAFCFGSDDSLQWNNIGHNHSVTLLDLEPGKYRLRIRSTNTDGVWMDNIREVVVVVLPTFWETPWAVVLIAALMIALVAVVAYTLLYIRRIKLQRQETLDKYLALIEDDYKKEEAETIQESALTVEGKEPEVAEITGVPAEDPLMQSVMTFVEKNLGNPDINIGDMAEACAVSRSVLQRKMKQMMGITPVDFIREARMKRACLLLRSADMTIGDVAYKCGFGDPKYFSRTFKNSTGMSPSEYKNSVNSNK